MPCDLCVLAMTKTGARSGGTDPGSAWHDQRWNARYRQLENFKTEHGHSNAPRSHEILGVWVHGQRTMYMKGRLSDERVGKLNVLGFDWGTTRSAPLTWDERFGELVEYKAENGHCNVPQKERPLGNWVSTQRQKYKEGKLSDERVGKLNDLGFDWGSTRSTIPWDKRFDELVEYKKEHRDCNVPRIHEQLGDWVDYQRVAHKKGKLSEERVGKLEGLGFDWNPPSKRNQPMWDERFGELVEYKKEHSDCKVPKRLKGLNNWVDYQRQAYKKGKLSDERVGKLEGLGFDWGSTRGTQLTWDERFDELVEYKNEHGDCRVPKRLKGLNNWVYGQRKARKKGRLSGERVEKLESLGFNFGQGTMSRPRSDAGVTGQGEADRVRRGKRHLASANDAGADSSSARSTARPAGYSDAFEVKNASQSAAMNDDEVDEIGALIYDQVMQWSTARPARYSVAFEVACPSQSAVIETEPAVADDAEATAAKYEAEEIEIEASAVELVRDRSAADGTSVASKVQPGADGDADCWSRGDGPRRRGRPRPRLPSRRRVWTATSA